MNHRHLFFYLFITLSVLPPAGRTQDGAPRETAGIRLPERPRDPWLPTPPQPEGRGAGAVVHEVGPYRSIQVNTDAEGRNIVGDAGNEPSMALDPLAPDRIVIGWRQFDTIESDFRQAGWAYTSDGGRTWTSPGVIEPGVFRSDPVLASDSAGSFYYASLTLAKRPPDPDDFRVHLFKSNDGGQSWGPAVDAFGGDKQWIAVDPTDGIGGGHVYHTFTSLGSFTDTLFTRSIDGGSTFEFPVGSDPGVSLGTLVVGSDGTLYIVGFEDDGQDLNVGRFLVARSVNARDPGATPRFDLVSDVDMGGRLIAREGPNPGGLLGQPWVAVHPARPDTVYVLSSVQPQRDDPLDVHFARSTDGGATWSAPVRVNDDAPGTNAYQWFGTLSVAPSGRLDAIWNDTRNDPDNPEASTSELFYAFSDDDGDTWSPNIAVSPPYNHFLGYPQQEKLGDYYQTISDDLGVHVAYAATLGGEQDVYYLRIGSYDCNQNGIADEEDLAGGMSEDVDADGIPDECTAAAARAALVAEFTASAESGLEPFSVTVDAGASTIGAAQQIVAYHWDFGDGNTAEGAVVKHTYASFGRYNLRLRVEDDLGRRALSGRSIFVEFRDGDVSPWGREVLGNLEGPTGASLEEECVLVQAGSGQVIARNSDVLHFVYQSMAGDFQFTARLSEWALATPDALASIMIRESLEANSRHGGVALVKLAAGFRHGFVSRRGVFTRIQDRETYERLDLWLRVERRGDVISGQLSVDGVTWTEPDSVELPDLAGEVHVGMALASSGDDPSVATFCDPTFAPLSAPEFRILRGDCNDNGEVDISDGRCILDWRFSGAATPGCVAATNTNGDAVADIADAIYLFSALFLGGPPPVEPFPECGPPGEEDVALGCATPPQSCP